MLGLAQAQALPDAQLSGIRGQMSTALGLQQAAPPKPLLWKAAGHPANPPTQALWEAAMQLHRLCDAATAGSGSGEGEGSSSRAATLVQLVAHAQRVSGDANSDMHAVADASADGEAARQLAASRAVEVVAAALPADWSLRQALLEGCGLFAVAVAHAAGRAGEQQLPPCAEEAEQRLDAGEIVGLLQARVEASVEQVGPCSSQCDFPRLRKVCS